MNKYITLITLLTLISCGKKTTVTKYYQDPATLAEIDKLKDDVAFLNSTLNNKGASIVSLEELMVVTQNRLTELELQERVEDIIDPCGDDSNEFDEVLFKMKSGRYIAYFEQGSNRFMTILSENTNYRTTDRQQCSFKIMNKELVETQNLVNFNSSQNFPSSATYSYTLQIVVNNLTSNNYINWKLTGLLPKGNISSCWENGGSITHSFQGKVLSITPSNDVYHSTFKANTQRTFSCQVNHDNSITPSGLNNLTMVNL